MVYNSTVAAAGLLLKDEQILLSSHGYKGYPTGIPPLTFEYGRRGLIAVIGRR